MKLWIARDENNELWIFDKKPILVPKDENYNYGFFDLGKDGEWNNKLNASLFPEVTFGNSPKEVEIKIIEK